MKRKNTSTTASWLVCLASAIALATPAWASQAVTITNAGFEDPLVADGSFTTSAPPGWTAFNNAAGDIGVWNPKVDDYPAEAPEGLNVFYVYFYGAAGEEGVSQVLSGTPLLADASYTLSVRVGGSNTYTFPGYKVQLLADGTVLAEDDNTQTPAAGTFATASVTYNYNAGLHAALVGKPLEIRLLGKGLVGGEGEFDDVKLDVTLANPIADPGGPYAVMVPDGSLSLDGSGSLPSEGQTIPLYQWDLDNDGDFDELVTGVTPAAIPYATLTGTYGMSLGPNTIKLKVTDSAAKSSTVEGIVEIKSRILVDEDWQDPLLNNGTQFTTSFTGWTFNGGAYSRRENNTSDLPGDSTVEFPNQAVELNGDATIGEINIAHNWAATDVYYLRIEGSPASWGGTNQRWIRPELRQQDGTLLWQAPQNATTAAPLYSNYMGELTDYPSELTFFFQIDASTFSAGTAGQPLRLRLDSSGQRSFYINNVSLVLGPLPEDTTPPAPDPLPWDIVPTVSNFTTISMRIGSARDPGDLHGVEYYFENLTNSTNSGWQNSREWVQTGLDFDTEYTYRVKARDKSPNQNESTTWSAEQSATTLPRDLTPPSPDPLTWDMAPTVADYRWITMSVSAATDISGVEYYFENVTKGTNSGWIAARAWTEKDLNPATSYTYRAKARDKSLDQNESTAWSTEQSATTPTEPAGTLLITRFQDPLMPDNTAITGGNLGNWTASGSKIRKYPTDGIRTDTDLATPTENRVVHFEWDSFWIEYNLPHNWSATDTFTLTLNASPQAWNGQAQRYVRPSLRQQNGTVLWAPGENMSGPEKTALPLYANIVGSSYQDDPNLRFSYTIPASAFSAGAEGQPIRLRIASSGVVRGLFIDNVHLSVSGGTGPSGYAAWATGNEPFDGDANGDGVKDGIAFLLGAANPGEDARGRLPTVTQTAGGLVLTFNCLPVAARGGATLKVEHSSDLGVLDPWTATADVVPDVTDAVPDNNVTFVVGAGPAGPPALNSVTATISSAAAAGGKLFGRLRATE